jgi:transcriptional regulator with PAS, ATPase and Fis domain
MAKLAVNTNSKALRADTVMEALGSSYGTSDELLDYFMKYNGENLLQKSVDELESNLINRCIADSAGNHTLAAKKLGISRATLYDKIKKLNR